MALGASLSSALTAAAEQVGKQTLSSVLTRSLAMSARRVAEQGVPLTPAVRRAIIHHALPGEIGKGQSMNAILRRARNYGLGINRQDFLKMGKQVKSWMDAKQAKDAVDSRGFYQTSKLPQVTSSPGEPYHAQVRLKYHDRATGQFRYRYVTVDFTGDDTQADIYERTRRKVRTWQKAGRYEDVGQVDSIEVGGVYS